MPLSRIALALALVSCAPAQAEPELHAEPSEPEAPSTPDPEPEPELEPEPEPDPDACPPRDAWPDGMACVSGGETAIGDDEVGRDDERPAGTAHVRAFFMDLTEVTNEAYTECVRAGDCRPAKPYRGYRSARQPVVAVSWHDAVAHCARLGARLPTDAEFDRAARGETNSRYPWGDDDTDECAHAVVQTRRGHGCGAEVTAEVGSRPPGHFGLFDLGGNVHEWVADRWSPCLRGCPNECGDACFGDDPRGPCAGEGECPGHPLRSIRGGSWYWPVERSRGSARRGARPDNLGGHRFGFRCARDVQVSSGDEESADSVSP